RPPAHAGDPARRRRPARPHLQPGPRRAAADASRPVALRGRPGARISRERHASWGFTMTMPTGVLLMAYGSPATLRDVKAYYTHIRGGRTPPAEQVAEVRARYERIG